MAMLQAGKMGVLDGAEKFDSRKGCKFSTYVKYWIRKGMLALLAENSGVTLLPVCLSLQPFADDMFSSLFAVRKKKTCAGESIHHNNRSAGKNGVHHPQGEGGAARDPVQPREEPVGFRDRRRGRRVRGQRQAGAQVLSQGPVALLRDRDRSECKVHGMNPLHTQF